VHGSPVCLHPTAYRNRCRTSRTPYNSICQCSNPLSLDCIWLVSICRLCQSWDVGENKRTIWCIVQHNSAGLAAAAPHIGGRPAHRRPIPPHHDPSQPRQRPEFEEASRIQPWSSVANCVSISSRPYHSISHDLSGSFGLHGEHGMLPLKRAAMRKDNQATRHKTVLISAPCDELPISQRPPASRLFTAPYFITLPTSLPIFASPWISLPTK